MSYATEIQFISNAAGTYEPQMTYSEFVKLATSQLNIDIAPDYGVLFTHNGCRYAATDGDIKVEYRESTDAGSWFCWWSIIDQYGVSGGSTTFSRSLREWMDNWFDRRMNWLEQSYQPED